jgi:hypothetical protein
MLLALTSNKFNQKIIFIKSAKIKEYLQAATEYLPAAAKGSLIALIKSN